MRGKRIITKEEDFGYICDVCGRECNEEHATLYAYWGYFSDMKDWQDHSCDMCESCYDKIRKYIEEVLGGKVIVVDKHNIHPSF